MHTITNCVLPSVVLKGTADVAQNFLTDEIANQFGSMINMFDSMLGSAISTYQDQIYSFLNYDALTPDMINNLNT